MAFFREDPVMALCLQRLLDRYEKEGRSNLHENVSITWIRYESQNPSSSSGYGTGWNSNNFFYPASVVKIIYALATEIWIQRDLIIDTPELRRALFEMISNSSNDATSFIVDILTGTTSGPSLNAQSFQTWKVQRELINNWLESFDWPELKNWNCCQKTWNEGPFGREKDFYGIQNVNRNKMTTNGTARIFESLMTNEIMSNQASKRLKSIFCRSTDLLDRKNNLENQVDGFLGEGLPLTSKLWSKAGLMSEARHDVAWWNSPKGNPMLLVVFTNGEELAQDRFLLPALSSEMNKLTILQ